jgi:hypothetical protein
VHRRSPDERKSAPGLLALLALIGLLVACSRTPPGPRHRERDTGRDRECRDPTRPRAFFYPAENRTDYKPDDPRKDGCELLVADHLFCCPDAPRSTDR